MLESIVFFMVPNTNSLSFKENWLFIIILEPGLARDGELKPHHTACLFPQFLEPLLQPKGDFS